MSETRLAETRLTAVHRLVRVALMAALIVVGSWVSLPIGPVPLTLQTFFIMLSGMLLGPRYGVFAYLLFVGAGCLGLPVFAGGKAGVGVLLGPTGGFLLGFIPLAFLSGFADTRLLRSAGLLMFGTALMYAAGTWRLMTVLNLTLPAAFSMGTLPFLPGDGLKIFAALMVLRVLRRTNKSRQTTPQDAA